MRTVDEIFSWLGTQAPLELQMDFDNSGFLLGHGSWPVSRALLALDMTKEVIEEASEMQAQLLISPRRAPARRPCSWRSVGSPLSPCTPIWTSPRAASTMC